MSGVKVLAVAVGVLTLAGCDKPNLPEPARDWAKAVTWDEPGRRFLFDGRPAPIVRVWDFERVGDAEGFTPLNAQMTPARGQGLVLINGPDPGLRSPDDLEIDGRESVLLLVRLTRRQATASWDGTVFHQTRWHGESEKFAHRLPQAPAVGGATVLVYLMGSSPAGGGDWTASRIKRLRIDLEGEGGETVIHQIALAQAPF